MSFRAAVLLISTCSALLWVVGDTGRATAAMPAVHRAQAVALGASHSFSSITAPAIAARSRKLRPRLGRKANGDVAGGALSGFPDGRDLSGLPGIPLPLPINPIGIGSGFISSAFWTAVDTGVLAGAGAALTATANEIDATTAPQLQSTWFSASYWRVAGLAALLTLPFLFAAAVQALMRADLGLLIRAAFGYLPLAMIGVGLATPLTMLLLSATDELCAAVSPSGASGAAHFLVSAAIASAGASAIGGSGFLAFIVGVLTVVAAIVLLLELLIREAAVYLVVLMLPLAFAAMVWPARRILASRMLELLVSLILSKFVIVAALSLGGAAYGNGTDDPSRLLTAMALVMLSTFAPWTMLRLIPFTEIAAGASQAIHGEIPRLARDGKAIAELGAGASEWLTTAIAQMRDHAQDAGQGAERAGGQPPLATGVKAPRHEPTDATKAEPRNGTVPASQREAAEPDGYEPAGAGEHGVADSAPNGATDPNERGERAGAAYSGDRGELADAEMGREDTPAPDTERPVGTAPSAVDNDASRAPHAPADGSAAPPLSNPIRLGRRAQGGTRAAGSVRVMGSAGATTRDADDAGDRAQLAAVSDATAPQATSGIPEIGSASESAPASVIRRVSPARLAGQSEQSEQASGLPAPGAFAGPVALLGPTAVPPAQASVPGEPHETRFDDVAVNAGAQGDAARRHAVVPLRQPDEDGLL